MLHRTEPSLIDRRPATDAAVAIARSVVAGHHLPPDSTLAFGPQGLASVHACLVDAKSMTCEASWTITQEGGVRDAGPDAAFARAMATIVHLNPPGERETVTRQLAPQHWALGWHVDERRVIVAEARYRAPHGEPGDVEVALLRMLCEARIRPAGSPAALDRDAGVLPEATDDQRAPPPAARMQATAAPTAPPHPAGGAPAAPAAPDAPDAPDAPAAPAVAVQAPFPAAPASPAHGAAIPAPVRHPRPWLLGASLGLVLAFAGGGLWLAQWREVEALATEARRLEEVAKATLVQSTAMALDRGDYGELQFELDRFQALRYFGGAVVLNSQGQVVSKTGVVHGVRIGEAGRPELVAGSRSFELRNTAGQALGWLLVWPARDAS